MSRRATDPHDRKSDVDVSRRKNGYAARMTVIGFHCSHEQISPAKLLRDVQHAERAGFTAGMSSDHLSPWSSRQNESGFAWAFLGAALATTDLPFGVVNAPGQRYHPAIIAQAIATLAQMFPGRFWAALGSGEASNERVTGQEWPRKEVRDRRLVECVDVIRRHSRREAGAFCVLDVAEKLRGTDLLVRAVESDDGHAVGIPVLPPTYVYVRFAVAGGPWLALTPQDR